jgi:hypothetical protein
MAPGKSMNNLGSGEESASGNGMMLFSPATPTN